MKKLKLDTGLVTYGIGQGVLQFNPCDINVYMRFQKAVEMLDTMEADIQKAAKTSGILVALADADKALKTMLNGVFGPGNDFDKICGGVSLFAADEKGQRLIHKLLSALEPVLVEGAKQCARMGKQ